ncbi:hypothetical protein, partial [Mycolicibacterium boenickei]
PAAPVAAPPAENKPSRLMQALAWVGIAAGTVFIVAVVFGTGFFLGAHSGGDGHHHRGGHDRGGMMMFHRGGPDGGPGQMGPRHGMMPPWGPGGPGSFGPGGPGWGPGPGNGPERPETPTTPAPPARP